MHHFINHCQLWVHDVASICWSAQGTTSHLHRRTSDYIYCSVPCLRVCTEYSSTLNETVSPVLFCTLRFLVAKCWSAYLFRFCIGSQSFLIHVPVKHQCVFWRLVRYTVQTLVHKSITIYS